MRVLHVSHTPVVSGAEHSLLDLVSTLAEHADVRLAAPPGDLVARARARRIPTTPIRGVDLTFKRDARAFARAARNAGAATRTLSRTLGGGAWDVVHANSVRAALVAGPAAQARRVPVVMHVRDVLPAGAASDAARHVTARLASAVAANSQYVAGAYREGLPAHLAARVAVVDNPVDLDRFAVRDAPMRRAARRALGIDDERPVLAIVGQITPWKGHDVALRTLAGVRARHPEAVLLVAGEVKFASAATTLDNPSYRGELARLAAALGLPACAVRYLGERDDVAAILAATDLLLAPSTVEPFGRSIVEAMAVGVPALATRFGGTAEFVADDRTGWLLDPRDATAWSACALRLLGEPERLAAAGRAASAAVRARFSRARHAAAMLALFEAAARRRSGIRVLRGST